MTIRWIKMAASLWLVFIVTPVSVLSYSPNTEYLQRNCDRVRAFSKDVILELSSYASTVTGGYTCRMTVRNQDSWRRVQARFGYLHMSKSINCSQISLTIFEGGSPLTPPGGVCGSQRPTKLYRTAGNAMSILLTNKGPSTQVDFQLLLTGFFLPANGSSCDDDDFRCANGICISDEVICNGYNDCGDNSDEDEGCTLAAGVIVGIVFGVIVFVIVCTALGVCMRRRRTYIRVTEDAHDLLVDHLHTLTAQFQMLEVEQELLKKNMKILATRTEWLQKYVRRQNLLFYGIPRTVTETHEQCRAKVKTLIGASLEPPSPPIPLQRVQRLGNVVVVRFHSVEDKLRVLAIASHLRNKGIRISEDFSPKVREIRKGLMELRNTYLSQGKQAVLRFDKLYTEFDVFTYDLGTRTVKKVDRGSSGHAQYLALRSSAHTVDRSASGVDSGGK